MTRLAPLAGLACLCLLAAPAARAQQIVDVQKKIDGLIAGAIEAQLRKQLGVSVADAPHADIKYDASKITNQVSGLPTMTFSENGLPQLQQVFVGCGFSCNDTNAEKSELEIEYQNDDEISQHSEWTVGLKLSSEFQFSAGLEIEGIGELGEKITMGVELSTDFTSGRESSQTIGWSTGFKVNTPPHSSLQAVMVVQKAAFQSTSFTLDTVLAGGANVPNVTYKFTDTKGKTVSSGKMDQLGFLIDDAYPNVADRTIQASGKFSGNQWGTMASFFTFNQKDQAAGTCSPTMPIPDCGTSMPSNAQLAGTQGVRIPKIQ